MTNQQLTGKEALEAIKNARGDAFSPWDPYTGTDVSPFLEGLDRNENWAFWEELFTCRDHAFSRLCNYISERIHGEFDLFGPSDCQPFIDFYKELSDEQQRGFDQFRKARRRRVLLMDTEWMEWESKYTYFHHTKTVDRYSLRERFTLVYGLVFGPSGLRDPSGAAWSEAEANGLWQELIELYSQLIAKGEIDKIPELEQTEAPAMVGMIEAPYLVWTKRLTDLALLFYRLVDEGFMGAWDVDEFIAHHIRLRKKDNTLERIDKNRIGSHLRQFMSGQPTAKGSPRINEFVDSYIAQVTANDEEADAA